MWLQDSNWPYAERITCFSHSFSVDYVISSQLNIWRKAYIFFTRQFFFRMSCSAILFLFFLAKPVKHTMGGSVKWKGRKATIWLIYNIQIFQPVYAVVDFRLERHNSVTVKFFRISSLRNSLSCDCKAGEVTWSEGYLWVCFQSKSHENKWVLATCQQLNVFTKCKQIPTLSVYCVFVSCTCWFFVSCSFS